MKIEGAFGNFSPEEVFRIIALSGFVDLNLVSAEHLWAAWLCDLTNLVVILEYFSGWSHHWQDWNEWSKSEWSSDFIARVPSHVQLKFGVVGSSMGPAQFLHWAVCFLSNVTFVLTVSVLSDDVLILGGREGAWGWAADLEGLDSLIELNLFYFCVINDHREFNLDCHFKWFNMAQICITQTHDVNIFT